MERTEPIASEEDQEICDRLNAMASKCKNVITKNWPTISKDQPISECDISQKIFCQAFPWLFPGGRADATSICMFKEQYTASNWAKRMLLFEDGRFAKDKMFCFYALNYVIRRRNRSQGNFYVDTFDSDCPCTLEELQEQIEKENTTFLDKVSYFSQRVVGSDPYWRGQRAQLNSWINQLIDWGYGAPNFFITLSCAEYYWPDITRLLGERIEIAEKRTVKLKPGDTELGKYANLFTVIIQEYFQQRVDLWLKRIRKPVLGLDKWWFRYEFAPGRGQIHVHILAVAGRWKIFGLLHRLEDEKKKASILAKWAEKNLGLTACTRTKDEVRTDCKESKERHPCFRYYSDVKNDSDDIEDLKQHVEMHVCNNFCLRSSSKEQKAKRKNGKDKESDKLRTCKVGAGTEYRPDSCATPGFDYKLWPKIEKREGHQRQKLYLTRNNRRLNQCSEKMLQTVTSRFYCTTPICRIPTPRKYLKFVITSSGIARKALKRGLKNEPK